MQPGGSTARGATLSPENQGVAEVLAKTRKTTETSLFSAALYTKSLP